MLKTQISLVTAALFIAACTPAQLMFGDGARPPDTLAFFDPSPHLLVTVSADCTIASQVVAIPAAPRWVRMKPGHGASDLSVGFGNGLITSVGQKSDTKVPETIGGIANLATAIGGIVAPALLDDGSAKAKPEAKTCPPEAHLFPIGPDGKVDKDTATDKLAFKVTPK